MAAFDEGPIIPIHETLGSAAVSDLYHDFKKIKTELSDYIEDYFKSLPNECNQIMPNIHANHLDEPHTLNNVISLVNNQDKRGQIYHPRNYITHTVETTTKYIYNVIPVDCYTPEFMAGLNADSDNEYSEDDEDVSKYISAEEFIRKSTLTGKSGLVVDATSISLFTILNNGSKIPESYAELAVDSAMPAVVADPVATPNAVQAVTMAAPDSTLAAAAMSSAVSTIDNAFAAFYYIYGPEVVNDPAGKKPLDHKCFNKYDGQTGNGAKLYPCISNEPPNILYNYAWVDNEDKTKLPKNPYDMFYTNLNFQLSELQYEYTHKTLKYTTNMNIYLHESDKPSKSENITDSGLQNSISNLLTKIKSLFTIFKPMHAHHNKRNEYIFSINSKFQQKRTGDWLQVLLCLLIKQRRFKLFAKTGASLRTEIQNEIDNVYFVTHDHIALAFALFVGVECIFTHAPSGKMYVYKINSPQQIKENIMNSAKKKYDNYIELKSKNIFGDITTRFTEYTRDIFEKKVKIHGDEAYNELDNLMIENISIPDITTSIRKVFMSSFRYSKLLIEIPDLSNLYQEIETAMKKLDAYTINDINDSDNPDNPIFNIYNNVYNNFIDMIYTFDTQFNKLVDTDKRKTIPYTFKYRIDEFNTKIIKQPSYKFIAKWDWDLNISSRLWKMFKNSFYSNDLYIFLHDINNIDKNLKDKIVTTFINLYRQIHQNPMYKTNEKFKTITSAFIVELLYSLTYKKEDNPNEYEKKIIIEEFIRHKFKENTDSPLSLELIMKEHSNIIDNTMRQTNINQTIVDINKTTGKEINYEDDAHLEDDEQRYLKGGEISFFPIFDFSPNILVEHFALKATRDLLTLKIQSDYKLLENDFELYQDIDNRELRIQSGGNGGEENYFKQHICFHPLLPIYMILDSFIFLGGEDIENTMDYTLYINYLTFLKKITLELCKIYRGYEEGKKNHALLIGLGLRALFFRSYSDNDKFDICDKLFNMNKSAYMEFTLMNGILSNYISGMSVLDENDDNNDKRILQHPVFVRFISSIETKKIFNKNIVMPIERINKESYNLFKEISKLIIRETTEPTNYNLIRFHNSFISNLSSTISPMPQSNKKEGNKMMTIFDLRKDPSSSPNSQDSVFSTTGSTGSSRSRGGKKTHRHNKKISRNKRVKHNKRTRRNRKTRKS